MTGDANGSDSLADLGYKNAAQAAIVIIKIEGFKLVILRKIWKKMTLVIIKFAICIGRTRQNLVYCCRYQSMMVFTPLGESLLEESNNFCLMGGSFAITFEQ
jgi:hypothetical protein